PIVMANIIDPVGSGFVASLARPGGNITGISNLSAGLSEKLVEILLKMLPKLSRVAVLLNPDNTGHRLIRSSVQAAADKAGIQLVVVEAATRKQLDEAFATMTRQRVGAFILGSDAFFGSYRPDIAKLAISHKLPGIAGLRAYALDGLLLGYGQDTKDNWRRSANFVDKILKGAKPEDLPVEQPTQLHLVINGKTAKALKLSMPKEFLLRADEVIE